MIDPLDFEKRPLLSLLSRKRIITAFVLFLENCSKSLWRILSWGALFIGLWLMQLPAILGTAGPALFFITFFTGLIYLIRRDLKKLYWPQKNEIDRRLEIATILKHRPISAIEDKLVNPRKEPTRILWQKNQDEAISTIKNLRVPKPRALLSQNDPLGFRTLAALVFIIGIIAAGSQWQERLAYGLFPFSFDKKEQKISNITLWVTPPDYTSMPQITLQGRGRREERLKVPEGTVLKARINKGFTQPVLIMGEQEIPLEKLGEQSWGLETDVVSGNSLTIKQWPFTIADIAIDFIIDKPPEITVNGAPEDLSKGETKLPLKVLDDYGVTDMTLSMELDPIIEDKPVGNIYEETRAIMSPPGTELEIAPVYDLSWHPWAGLPVIIKIEGIDHLGQKSDIIPLHMTLPERPFSHPIAKQLIALRKRLIWTPERAASNVAFDLQDLLTDTAQQQSDIVSFLAIRSASSRLSYDPGLESVSRVIELLWDTALRIEEGNLPIAARNMRDAQRNLEQVLKNPNATDEEIAQALQEMRKAMAEYFQEMYRELQKRMAENGKQMQMPPEMFQNMVQPEDLAAFFDRLQSEALSGDKNAARELLSQLQQFMDKLNPSMEMTMPPQMEFMMEGINELQELIEKQQALLDQTQKQADRSGSQQPQTYPEFMPFNKEMLEKWGMGNMPPPPQTAPQKKGAEIKIDTQKNKVEQDALRYILGQLMLEADEQLGEIPENMQLAEQEMRDSADRLSENKPDSSLPHQEQAIKYLQEAMQNMTEQMQQMMQQMTMLSLGGMGQIDPLGRPIQEGKAPGLFPGSRVEIPDEAERKRAREILKILRQRSGEINRPNYELEYYRRLMKQF